MSHYYLLSRSIMRDKKRAAEFFPKGKAHGGVRKTRPKVRRKSVLKMLAVMDSRQTAGPSSTNNTAPTTPDASPSRADDFLASGRTGRRNALPDILSDHALVTSSDLPSRLQALSTSERKQDGAKDQAGPSNR